MKLDAKTVAALKLDGKQDAIFFDDAMPGFGFRLRLSAGELRRTWVCQYKRAGATRRITLGSADVLGVEAARTTAKKILAKVALGEDPQANRRDRRDKDRLSFRGVVEDFLAAKEREVRPRTHFQLKRYLTGPYLKAFHTMPLDRVNKRDIASRILTIAHENGPAVAREVRGALSGYYAWCMQMGLAEANPTIGTRRPKTNEPRERVLDDGELVTIWKACGDDDYGRIVRLLILTGCRRAEIGDMRWSEIDLERGTFTIPATRSKNHRQHVLPLMPAMREIITGVPRMASRDQLFGLRAAGFTAWSWKESKPALDERSGVRDWTVHDLRRTVATKMADIGVQPHIIEAALNHFSGHRGGIAGVYNRSTYEREVRNALATWHDHLRALVEGGERKVLNFQPSQAVVP
jgi:integrase